MTSIDLKSFCGLHGDDMRPWMFSPFSHEDFTYATDGAILIRVPFVEGWPPTDFKNLGPHVISLFKDLDKATFVAPAPVSIPDDAIETSEQIDCVSCDGRGNYHECPDCTCGCDDCGGTGIQTTVDKISTVFYGNIYRLKYIRQMLALPGLEIAPDSPNEPKHIPLLFRFDGGAGVLMPRNSRCGQHVEIEGVSALTPAGSNSP